MDPLVFSQLVQSYLAPAVPGSTFKRTLEIYANTEAGPEQLLELLESNPAYKHFILKERVLAKKIAEWAEEDPKRVDQDSFLTKRLLGLLGKTATRNLIASLQIARASNTGLPRKKDEPLAIPTPARQIPFALKTETFLSEHDFAFTEAGFIGGFHYDLLAALMTTRKASEEQKRILTEAFEKGFLTAQIAYRLSQSFKKIQYDRWAFAAALVLPLGKALMALAFPKGGEGSGWSALMAECEKYGRVKSDAAELLERKQFQVSFSELSALFVQSAELMQEVAPALRFALEPWMLLDQNEDQYLLAMILSTSVTLARALPIKPGDALPLRGFQRSWLKASRVQERTLIAALQALSKESKE